MNKRELKDLSDEALEREKHIRDIHNNATWIKVLKIVVPLLTVGGTLLILSLSKVFEANNEKLDASTKLLEAKEIYLNMKVEKEKQIFDSLGNQNAKLDSQNIALKIELDTAQEHLNSAADNMILLIHTINEYTSQIASARSELSRTRDSINMLRGRVFTLSEQQASQFKGYKQDNGSLKIDTAVYRHIIRSSDKYISEVLTLIEGLDSTYNFQINVDSVKAQRPNSAYRPHRVY